MMKTRKITVALVLVGLALITTSNAFAHTLADKIGVAHTDGSYSLTGQPFLLEGAKQIRSLGSRVIKVFLQDPARKYPHNSYWPSATAIPDLVDVLQTDDFEDLFNMDFGTFVLQAHLDTVDDWYWYDGLDEDERKLVMRNYYDAAKYLLQQYAGTGKRFILEHWEADLYFKSVREAITAMGWNFNNSIAQKGLLDYFDARAEGVRRARDEVGEKGVSVQTAVELIWISTHTSEFRLIDQLESVRADMIAYSMSEECTQNTQAQVQNIQTLIERAGGRPWYIGEFAAAEARFSAPSGDLDTTAARSKRQEKAMLSQIKVALDLGAEFVCLWQIYNNGTDYNDSEGYGLIRGDGTKTELAQYLPSLTARDSISSEDFISMEFLAGLEAAGWPRWILGETDSVGAFASAAVISSLARPLYVTPGEGLVMHTARIQGGRIGDTHADVGETVTLHVDSQAGMPIFLIATPLKPTPWSRYSDDTFLWPVDPYDNEKENSTPIEKEDETEGDERASKPKPGKRPGGEDAVNREGPSRDDTQPIQDNPETPYEENVDYDYYEDYDESEYGNYNNGWDNQENSQSSTDRSRAEQIDEILSGAGCSSGFGTLALLLVGLMAWRKQRGR